MPLSFQADNSSPFFSIKSSLLSLQGQLSQVTALAQRSQCRIHKLSVSHIANLAIREEGRVFRLSFSFFKKKRSNSAK